MCDMLFPVLWLPGENSRPKMQSGVLSRACIDFCYCSGLGAARCSIALPASLVCSCKEWLRRDFSLPVAAPALLNYLFLWVFRGLFYNMVLSLSRKILPAEDYGTYKLVT